MWANNGKHWIAACQIYLWNAASQCIVPLPPTKTLFPENYRKLLCFYGWQNVISFKKKLNLLYKIQWIVFFQSLPWQKTLCNLFPAWLSLVKLSAAYFWYFLRQMQSSSREKFFRKTFWSHSLMQIPLDWTFSYCKIILLIL